MKIWLAIVFGSALAIVILWLTALPLGVQGEWVWERSAAEPDLYWNLCGGFVAAALLIAFVLQGRRRFDFFEPGSGIEPVSESLDSGLCAADSASMDLQALVPPCAIRSGVSRKPGCVKMPAVEFAAWLIGLVAISFIWIWIVQEISPVKNRLGKAAFVLYYPSTSGYFTRARYEEPEPRALLAGYEELMRQGDVLHTGTHPPGLFLVFQGLIRLCYSSPQLSAVLDATQSASFREACDVIATNSVSGRIPRPLLVLERRVLWMATVLVMLLASMTVIPLFGLLRRNCSLTNAWTCASLWPSIPAVAVFIPKSDAAFPLIGVTLTWLWLTAWDRRSLTLALLAGLVTWCGLICSLAFLPVILAAGLLTLGSSVLRRIFSAGNPIAPDSTLDSKSIIGWRRWACVAAAGFGIALPTSLLWIFAQVNLLNVWAWNYRNHAGFYGQYSRTYWKWLLINPFELSFAAGWPVTLLAIGACIGVFRRIPRRVSSSPIEPATDVLSIVIVWGLLWLTGKNSGEAARLWILFLPWAVWLASIQLGSMSAEKSKSEVNEWQAFALLALQFTVCLLTVARVSGFDI